MTEITEQEILSAIKKNPELVKEILKKALKKSEPKPSNNRFLNEYLYNKIKSIFKTHTHYRIQNSRSYMTSVMRMSLGVGKSKEVPDEKVELAKEFYDELVVLILKYIEKSKDVK